MCNMINIKDILLAIFGEEILCSYRIYAGFEPDREIIITPWSFLSGLAFSSVLIFVIYSVIYSIWWTFATNNILKGTITEALPLSTGIAVIFVITVFAIIKILSYAHKKMTTAVLYRKESD